ncbi:hypothetical protein L249_7542 [Ophiocordyceps polyrhachis-furcata BCC 54312]|uniref:Uncharacterized protein n=1 Tax=Ophiocordyceps polyrhachis-furcata BCC 54312 TaxID=1330021 RepID=A0A367LAH5_9HYPO|nr:hypothetical protein L249_7542 [Ophiocordyceps polyrhachis-furcata BCC 54312]
MDATSSSSSSPPPEVVALASRMYDAARRGDLAVFQQALPAGLPANLTNEKGETLCVQMFQQGQRWAGEMEMAKKALEEKKNKNKNEKLQS